MALIIDGGFSSQIIKYVGELDKNPLWCSKYLWSNPQAVINTHYDYAADMAQNFHRGAEPYSGLYCWMQGGQLDPVWSCDMCFHGGMVLGILFGQYSSTMEMYLLCCMIKAGADIITTNTYQAYIGGFQKYLGLTKEESIQLIKKAVQYAQEAISKLPDGRRVMIAGSVGPYGASLHDGSEYNGNYMDAMSKEILVDWHRPRIKALVEAGVDFLALETIPCLEEADALTTLLKEFPEQKAWMSFSCMDDKHISHGEEFSKVVTQCWKQNPEQLVAVGTNCVNPKNVTSLLKSVRAENQDIPLIVYPNSGEMWQAGVGWVGKQSCVPLITYLPEWLSLGVHYIGGCCQTTADDIRQYRNFLDNNSHKTF